MYIVKKIFTLVLKCILMTIYFDIEMCNLILLLGFPTQQEDHIRKKKWDRTITMLPLKSLNMISKW